MRAATTLLENFCCGSGDSLHGLDSLVHHGFHVSIEDAHRGCKVRYAGRVHGAGSEKVAQARSRYTVWQGQEPGRAKLGGNAMGWDLKNLVP